MAIRRADEELQASIQGFIDDLTEMIQKAALEAVQAALGAVPSRGSAARRAPVRKAVPKKRVQRRGKRVRRNAADVQMLADRLLASIAADPGRGLGPIAAGLGVEAKELRHPLNLLLDSSKIRMEGTRRGAKYYAGARRAKGKRKVARKA